MGNEIVTKRNMYYTNCHRTNHNVETCRSKKKEEPIVIATKAIMQVSNLQDH